MTDQITKNYFVLPTIAIILNAAKLTCQKGDRQLALEIKIVWRNKKNMASGLFALLDDVSALVKASAASLDDVPAQVI